MVSHNSSVASLYDYDTGGSDDIGESAIDDVGITGFNPDDGGSSDPSGPDDTDDDGGGGGLDPSDTPAAGTLPDYDPPDDSGGGPSSPDDTGSNTSSDEAAMDPSDEFVAGLYADTGDAETNRARSDFLNREDVNPGDLGGELTMQIFAATDTPVEDTVQETQNQLGEMRNAVIRPIFPGYTESANSDRNFLIVLVAIAAGVLAVVFGGAVGGN